MMSRKSDDISGKRYERLKVLYPSEKRSKSGNIYYWCKCDCGVVKEINGSNLKSGSIKSCGCFREEKTRTTKTKHGMRSTRLYNIWSELKQRCLNPNNKDYVNYGGRGIEVCNEWKNDFMSFCNWAMSNGYDEKLTIDRVNVNGNYEPSNCRWVTQTRQARNKSTNRLITIDGMTKTLSEWCEVYSVHISTAHSRIKRGKTGKEIFTKNIS